MESHTLEFYIYKSFKFKVGIDLGFWVLLPALGFGKIHIGCGCIGISLQFLAFFFEIYRESQTW